MCKINKWQYLSRDLWFLRWKALGASSPLADFGRLRKTSDVFGNLRKWSCRLQKSQHSQDKNLTLIYQKKLAGIEVVNESTHCGQKKSRKMHKYEINLTPPIRAWFSFTRWKFISIVIISRWTEFFWIRRHFMLDTWFHAISTHATRGSAADFQCVCGRPS